MNFSQDAIFCEHYERVKKVLCYLWLISTPIKIVIGIIYSFEITFGNNQWKITLSFSIILLGLITASRYSISIKRFYFLLFVQSFSIILKYMSLKVEPEAELLYCILNTIFVLIFETLVYQNTAWVAFSMLKLLVIWVVIDFKNPENELKLRTLNTPIIMASLALISMTCFYENLKIQLYNSEFESKKICKTAHDQLFDILKVFPDGLMVISSKNILKFKNNTITEILNNVEDPISYLNSVNTANSNISTLQLVKEFFAKNNTESSFGILSIDSKQYECRAHKIQWDAEDSCMLTLKNVTSILTLERINAENNAKNSIIRSISHEFRTPINCIDFIIDEILPKLAKEFQIKLDVVKVNTKLLIYQLNDILDYSDISSGKLKLFDSKINIKEKLTACIELIKHQAEYKGLSVIANFEKSVPDKIVIDGYRIQKVLVNLLTNALKYTSKGSITLFASCKENYLQIGVEDTGIGIPLERQNKLFDMSSNNSNGNLCGLGLHVSKRILESLNSNLKVKSTLDEGTTFTFDLDLDKISPKSVKSDLFLDTTLENVSGEIDLPYESASNSKFKHLTVNNNSGDFAKVMIVDDNEFNRMCLASICKNEGIQYVEASDGNVAVNKVLLSDQNCTPIKLIIMDLNMPVMDGWEATRLINQLYSQGKLKALPIVVGHTAYCSQEDLQRCFEAGMITYLIKPTPQTQILSVIRKYI